RQTITIDGASIEVSEKAMNSKEIVRVRSLHTYDMPTLPTDIVNVSVNGAGYRFLPDNTIFNTDLTIKIGYDQCLIPDGYTCHDIVTMYYDVNERSWKKVRKDSVDVDTKSIISKTNHFTDYINGIIKVPENPETAGYTPNTFNDYKVGDVSSQIPSLSIPSANTSGSLSTTFPIKIPQGRQGMQPQLSINYSSESQGGWLGQGWDMPISSISVDTRWGVPRYMDNVESETYLLDGAQLIGYDDGALAHREFVPQTNETKRFRRRIEGNFGKIERFGNDPSNYRWIVTGKDGTKYYYGGVEDLDMAAVLQQPGTGNIAKWCLVRVMDSNGNTINYSYNILTHDGVVNGQTGKQIYLEEINYTGYNDEPGKYTVKFLLNDAGNNPTPRQDIKVSCNYGLKVVEPYRLDRIVISFLDQKIRTYDIEYLYGAYSKSLVKHIAELDQDGNEFYRWKMEYYDEVRNDDGDYIQFDDEFTEIDCQNDNIDHTLIRSVITENGLDKSSAVGGSSSDGWSAGVYVGIGPNTQLATKNLTVGYSYNYASTNSNVLNMLIDIDGDGLPDKVFDDGDVVKCRKNLFDPISNTISFSDPPIDLQNLTGIGNSHSSTQSHGPQVTFSPLSAGITWGKTKTETKSYLMDKNGDRLVDVVQNNSVYFNKGNGNFDLANSETPNPLYNVGSSSESNNSEIEIYTQQDIDAQFAENPLHDVVRVWTAPVDGSVEVSSEAWLIDQPLDSAYPFADGVYASIENDNGILDSLTLLTDSQNFNYLDTIPVDEGERIFFRLQSRVDGDFDKVIWNPQIEYIENPVEPNDTVVEIDANGQPLWQFDAKEDFFVTGRQYLYFDTTGQVEINGTFIKPFPVSDTIYLQLVHFDLDGIDTVYEVQRINPETIYPGETTTTTITISVDPGDVVLLRSFVYSNINWDSIFWKPVVTHIAGTGNTEYKPIAERVGYNQFVWNPGDTTLLNFMNIPPRITRPIICPDDGLVSITPKFLFSNNFSYSEYADETGIVSLSVKKNNQLLARQSYHVIENTNLYTEALSFNVLADDTIYIEFSLSERAFFDSLSLCRIDDIVLTGFDPAVEIDFENAIDSNWGITTIPNVESHLLFGPCYRNWGQFCYKADTTNLQAPIDENELNFSGSADTGLYNSESEIGVFDNPDDFDQNPNTGSPLNAIFIYMTPDDSTLNRWLGYDNLTYIAVDTVSSSRFGQDNMILTSVITPEPGMEDFYFMPDKVVHSTSTTKAFPDSWNEIPELAASTMAGIIGVNLSFTDTEGSSEMLMDMMDLNGDGFPDIIAKDKYQYTLPGGHFEETTTCDFHHETKSNSEGISVGGVTSSTSVTVNSGKGKLNKEQNTSSPRNNSGIGFSGLAVACNDAFDDTEFAYLDINGDGLPDRLDQYGKVHLNVGYDFLGPENWNYSGISHGLNTSGTLGGDLLPDEWSDIVGIGLNGVNVQSGSISFGTSGSSSSNSTETALMDINGDGLLDIIETDASLNIERVRFNKGCGFSGYIDLDGLGKLEAGSGDAESLNGAITFSIPLFFVKISINPGGDYNRSINRTMSSFLDINGDGVPDYLKGKRGDESMEVKFGRQGKTNLLKKVEGVFGASFTVDYERTANTFDKPGIKWNMTSLKVTDGFAGDGPDTIATRFDYDGGRYDRREKTEIGYYKVVRQLLDSNDDVYQIITQEYDSSSYYANGLLLSTTLTNGQGNVYTRSVNNYEMRNEFGEIVGPELLALNEDDATWAFPALVSATQEYYEGGTNSLLSHTTNLNYDNIGNVTQFEDLGSGSSDEYVRSEIIYQNEISDYIVNTPLSVSVKNSNDLELRYAEQEADSFGNITEIRQYIDESQYAKTSFVYDTYGNTTSVTYPANYNDSSMFYLYAYDPLLNTFNIAVTDAFGYSSSASYDSLFGVIKQSVDMNGQIINYNYDNKGRTISVQGPRELAAGQPFTIKLEYFEQAEHPHSVVQHFLEDFPQQPIETVTFVDGLFRPVQIKKTSSIYTGENSPDDIQFTVSGKIIYDAFGRVIRTYQPSLQTMGALSSEIGDGNDAGFFSSRGYDLLNRVTVDTLEDGSTSTYDYFIENYNGIPCFKTTATDPLGNSTTKYSDARQRMLMQARSFGNTSVVTAFEYNAISELLTTTDPLGNNTVYEYDKLGRKIIYDHPDGGLTKFEYDLAGNLLVKTTANLSALFPDGGGISYEYTYDRLKQINYPINYQNRVKYHYGEPGAPHNRAGRMYLQEDATGGQEFFYGSMGETVKTIRTIVLSQSDMRTFIWEDLYDSWNRALTKTYADGEVVSYHYNSAGKLKDMTSVKDGINYEFVRNIGYNEFDERVHIAYGNGTETNYEYEPARRRLLHVLSTDSSGNQFMNYTYHYDSASNILALSNDIEVSDNAMGGPTSFNYEYDELYRLTHSTGTYEGFMRADGYELNMEYDVMGKILNKQLTDSSSLLLNHHLNYTNAYSYGGNHPSAPTQIGSITFDYDHNGNMTYAEQSAPPLILSVRQISWDEENRMMALSDDGYLNLYTYDASGERILKSHGGTQGLLIDGSPVGFVQHADNATMYVSPDIVVSSEGFTKHYYVNGQRIASKTGTGEFNNSSFSTPIMTAGNLDYSELITLMQNAAQQQFNNLGLPPGPPTMPNQEGYPAQSGEPIVIGELPEYANDPPENGWPMPPLPLVNTPGAPPGPPTMGIPSLPPDSIGPGYLFTNSANTNELNQYFFHSDHVSSTNYITDIFGQLRQHLEYIPFGETFIDEHTNSETSPYLFSGKELDETTGLYYYGARYYNPQLSIWVSVDPLSGVYPSLSPYNYCLDNPINLVDPDGRQAMDPNKVTKLTGKYNRMIISARAAGKNKAADNLQHFLMGTGSSKNYEASWLRGFEPVRDAENRILKYVEKGNLKKWIASVDKNSTIEKSDHWDADIYSYNPWSELTYASGASDIKGNVDFTLTRGDDDLINVSGKVNIKWSDSYDW
ncbi:MAG: SpvB/TcaC N-terminal domain-containing protein, partial [Flavobacteriales bacterium]